MKKRSGFILMLLFLLLQHAKAENLIPKEYEWESLGDATAVSLVATGPYYEKTNIVVIVYLPHPEIISKVIFSNGMILDHPVLKEYELSLGSNNVPGDYLLAGDVYDLAGRVQQVSTKFTVLPSNRFIRGLLNYNGLSSRQDYLSSIITVDEERGDFLDGIQDFSLLYGTKYPWFLRATSEINTPCQHIIDPTLYPWPSPTKSPCFSVNTLPVLNSQIVGGAPPMMGFGSSAKNGTPLFVNQDYHFGLIAGRPAPQGALKIEVYEKSDFENGAINVAPVLITTNNLPSTTDPEQLEALRNKFYIQDYHLTNNIHGKILDFDTKVEYQFGSSDITWGNSDFVTPLLVTHRSANDLFYYKVSFKGDAPSLNPLNAVCMAFQVDEQGQHEAYNLTYALDFTQPDSWTTIFIHEPSFQNAVTPSPYLGKSVDELLHHTPMVQDTLLPPGVAECQRLEQLDKTPELKVHAALDELVTDLHSDADLKSTALNIANYVQNSIELTDAVGLSQTNDPIAINPQGVMRDALGTYLEGQGSPTEQCALLIYLLRKAGIPAGYIFPERDSTFLFDQQLSGMLHMQLRGTANIVGQRAEIPELIPVNYPWVAAYVDGKWVHLFPWIKDVEVKEGKDLWSYFPDDCKDARQWVCQYLRGDSSIRSLSKEDNPAALFPLYAEKYLHKKNLTLEDVGIRFKNRKDHQYQDWSEFPRPWKTPAVGNKNLVDHLSDDFFDTISVQVFSDRNGNGQPDPGEPILETGDMRFADLHNRRLLLYHQVIPSTNTVTPQYQMILSLEPYDSTVQSYDEESAHSFFKNGSSDVESVRAGQKISTTLSTAAAPGDLNDDMLCYKITRTHHKQAIKANKDYFAQFPTLIENMDFLVDQRPLRKGDMAVLSLDYGRVSEEMKNFELKKYLNYQQFLQEHPEKKADPEMTTGQLLQLMGMTYYYHVAQFQENVEAWTKTHAISYRAHGLTKLSPEYGAYGPVTNSDHGKLDFNLCYPRLDMSFQRAVIVGNQTAHLESGANTEAGAQSLQLLCAETSAQEHHVINEFFNQADAISTVKLFDLMREQGGEVLVLRQDNYERERTNSVAKYSAKNKINEFLDLWNSITSFFQNNKNDPFATVFLTPKPVTAEKQWGTAYTGMGAFSISSTSCGAWITDRMFVVNGGYGGCLEKPIMSYQPAIADTFVVAIPGGGFSFCQDGAKNSNDTAVTFPAWTHPNYLATLPSSSSVSHFNKFNDEVTAGQQSLAPDVMSSVSLWNYTVHQAVGDDHALPEPILSTTGSQTAALWKAELNKGNIGLPCYYTPSAQAKEQGVWKLVHDPVNVETGEFYINAADLEFHGIMPLEVRRLYSSQNQTDNNLGYGWKLNYFPYLMLSDDGDETKPASLIYAAEPDGSVIAYRYDGENKNWAPSLSDNPSLTNNNDGSSLKSKNAFNNRITKSSDGAYILKLADGSTRTFVTKSFPLSEGLSRTRPYLDHWTDVDGNLFQFYFGESKMANDFGQIRLIASSNGNSLRFHYDPYGRISEVFSSDGRHLKYDYDAFGDLVSVMLPDGSKIHYQYQHASEEDQDKKTYSTHLITQVTKPQGRIIQNDYDSQRRVTRQRATTGLNSKPRVAAQFTYDLTLDDHDRTVSGKTTVTDASNNQTIYEIVQNQITAVHLPEGRNIMQTWSAGNLMSRTDRRGLKTTFGYDQKGNLVSQTANGNLTGNNNTAEEAITQFYYNDKNLLTGVTPQLGNETKYAYEDEIHPASPTRITQIADGKIISTTQLSYQNTGGACGLLATSDLNGAITTYDYNGHGFLAAMTQKTGTADPDVVTRYVRNQRGEVVTASLSDRSQRKYSYDVWGHPTGVEVYDSQGGLIDWHFNYYNENGEIEWKQGARFNPVDYTYYDYDRAGNLLHQASCLRAGLAVTSYQYDQQGNCTCATDPNGNATTMSYDGLGEMLSRKWGDGSEEYFSYESGGKVATHQTVLGGGESCTYTSTGLLQSVSHADGTEIQYRYDLSGRLVEEVFSNGLDCKISYQGNVVTYSFNDAQKNLGSITETYDACGNLIQKTDLAGNSWSYSYDSLNRLKTEQGPPPSNSTAQQRMSYSYGPGFVSIVNGVGESSSYYFDALGRPTLVMIFNQDGSVAQHICHQYSGDHTSVMSTVGTGDHAITTTMHTDEFGHPTIFQHADGSSQQWTYDLNGNLISFKDESGHTTTYTYDALNHLVAETRPDGTMIKSTFNAVGELLTRSMPQGLIEKNNYNSAGEKISSSLIGADGAITQHAEYDYNQGLLSSVTDPRGGKTSIDYDSWMHPVKVSSSGFSIPEQNQITTYSYDPRGLLASVEQKYDNDSTGPSTLLLRDYDSYGQLISERTSLNRSDIAAWNQRWDAAGRRSLLEWSLDSRGKRAQYEFSYNALGLMTRAQNGSGTLSCVYGDHGLLLSESTPAGQKNLQRDQRGRIIHQTLPEQSEESLSWRNDGKMKSYSIVGSANETRNYEYDLLGRLTQEPYTLECSADPNALPVGTHTATYSFDPLGVRLKQEVTPEIKNSISEKNSFSQIIIDDLNSGVNKTYPWTSSYDAAGAVTARSIKGEISQDLTWDSFGRLVGVLQHNKNNQGYNWKTSYDGLGRRIQTSYCDASGNNTTSEPLAITYFYDPEVEFLELGRDYFGRTWNLYGPDRSGFYGGAQGIGGLEATTAEDHDETHGVVNNVFGDSVGITTGGVFQAWGNALGGYGAMPGGSVNTDLVPQWRDHYLDWTGFYYMGARYYEPKSGRFLSPDPLGHDTSLSLYDYCDGDPVNGLDADGRCVEKVNNAKVNVGYSWGKAMNEPDADIGERILAGIPVSIMSGDVFTHYTRPQEYMREHGSMPIAFSANGIFATDFSITYIRTKVAEGLNYNEDNVFSIQNPSYGPLDLIRAGGQQAGAIDITALRAADMINASGGGVFADHSNGSALFYAASALLRSEVKANMIHKGYGPQININSANVPGLRSYYNVTGSNDWISRGLNLNAHWDKIIPQSPFHPYDNHMFKQTYAPEVY